MKKERGLIRYATNLSAGTFVVAGPRGFEPSTLRSLMYPALLPDSFVCVLSINENDHSFWVSLTRSRFSSINNLAKRFSVQIAEILPRAFHNPSPVPRGLTTFGLVPFVLRE